MVKVLVVNDVLFKNMIIISKEGEEMIIRKDKEITTDTLKSELEKNGLNIENIKVVVVGENFRGETRAI